MHDSLCGIPRVLKAHEQVLRKCKEAVSHIFVEGMPPFNAPPLRILEAKITS